MKDFDEPVRNIILAMICFVLFLMLLEISSITIALEGTRETLFEIHSHHKIIDHSEILK